MRSAAATCRAMHAVNAGDVRARHGEPDQRRRNWVLIYGHLGFPGDGRRRLGVGDGDLARLHAGGRCCSRCGGSISKRTAELLGRGPSLTRRGPVARRPRIGPRAAPAAARARAPGRIAGGRRGRRVRAGNGVVRHARSDLERRAPDRAQHGRCRVHDSARTRIRRRGACRPRGRRRRSRCAPRPQAGPRSCSASSSWFLPRSSSSSCRGN